MPHQSAKSEKGSPIEYYGESADSLACVLQAIVRQAGYPIDHDTLNAVLGLSWSAIAVPFEDDPGRWPLYARDAFLMETGRLFGMTIRAVHPPEAARGLRGMAEFRQHFDASYRPHVLWALKNGQHVLAWQGWPGKHDLLWGIITHTCNEGVGFTGRVFTSESDSFEGVLHQPPVQLYVVESIAPTKPDAETLFNTAIDHALVVLDNGLADRFGVLTGPAAFDEWVDRLRVPHPSASSEGWGTDVSGPVGPPSLLRQDGPHARLIEGHRRLASTVIAGLESTARFLESQDAQVNERKTHSREAMSRACRTVIRSLEDSVGPTLADVLTQSPSSWNRIVGDTVHARDATKEMLGAMMGIKSPSRTGPATQTEPRP